MNSRRAALSCLSLSFSLSAACAVESADKVEVADELSELSGMDTSSDAFSARMLVVGELAYGADATIAYRPWPRYRAVTFAGSGGDEIDVRVRSTDGGDAVAWVLDADFRIVGLNDDAGAGTLDAHVSVTLPEHASRTHYIVVRDYWLERATFVVSLDGAAAVPSCRRDGDCPQPPLDADGRTAICDNDTHTCELVLPADIACGGFSLNPHACPPGWVCRGDGLALDLPGECVKTCGGLANLACPDGLTCVDDVVDDCDPADGGADCGGICLPAANADCRATGCEAGRSCQPCWGSFACIPDNAIC